MVSKIAEKDDFRLRASIAESNCSKAVAVHAGGHPYLGDCNFGFLIKMITPVFKE